MRTKFNSKRESINNVVKDCFIITKKQGAVRLAQPSENDKMYLSRRKVSQKSLQ